MAPIMKRSSTTVSTPTIRRMVRSMIESRIEHKHVTNVGAFLDFATAGVVNGITSAIPQGDDINQRSGDVIRPKSIKLRINFVNLTGSVTNYVGRVIVFHDTMANGASPLVTDVLATADPFAGWNVTNHQAHRFKILYDKVVTPVSLTDKASIFLEPTLKLVGTVHYLQAAAVSANQGKNSLFALFISSAASVNLFRFSWSYDLEYTDA